MGANRDNLSFDFASLDAHYAVGDLTPTGVVERTWERSHRDDGRGVWIHRVARDELLAAAADVEQRRRAGDKLPLYGLPFAVIDNIDVAGLPTTAGCPEYAYTPSTSAPVVDKLLRAGAMLVGKTNLDQFATGLVGVRSPYGTTHNPFDPRYIAGGSSSGSAVAVSAGIVSFALGTDSAGSGRIPAAFTNIVGLKPSRGLLSTRGVVPACRSLDCVSILALTCGDACAVAEVAKGYDADDGYSRREADEASFEGAVAPRAFRFGVPAEPALTFLDDEAAQSAFAQAVLRLSELGGRPVTIDFAPFAEAATLLYEGPWVAERAAGLKAFVDGHPRAVLAAIRDILAEGARYDAISAFRAMHRLEELRQAVRLAWRQMDVLLVPTTPTIFTIADVFAEARRLDTSLGYYTNFVNLLDLAAIAVPNGLRADGLPTGVTFIGPHGTDAALAALGAAFMARVGGTLGATGHPAVAAARPPVSPPRGVKLAVAGLHLTGQSLNHELTDMGARLVRACRTAPVYRLYALRDATPPAPALFRSRDGDGASIEVEVWQLATSAFGEVVARTPRPLCIGTVELEDGEQVRGALCESDALAGAADITAFGGWRAYVERE